jgi:hypothetical protein
MRRLSGAIAVVVCAALACSSCATLFQGTSEEIMVASDPAGAQVTTTDGRGGTTPFSMRVNRNEDVQIHLTKAGYAPTDINDGTHVEWGYLVSDLFFTGLIGLAVDGIDGAMFYHNQEMVAAHLDPLPVTQQEPEAKASAPIPSQHARADRTYVPNPNADARSIDAQMR